MGKCVPRLCSMFTTNCISPIPSPSSVPPFPVPKLATIIRPYTFTLFLVTRSMGSPATILPAPLSFTTSPSTFPSTKAWATGSKRRSTGDRTPMMELPSGCEKPGSPPQTVAHGRPSASRAPRASSGARISMVAAWGVRNEEVGLSSWGTRRRSCMARSPSDQGIAMEIAMVSF